MAADNGTGTCFPSKLKIAETWGLSRRTVDTAMKRILAHQPALVRATRHRTVRGAFGANDYQLLDPFDDQASTTSPGVSSTSSVGKLTDEIVSAQKLREDHAQFLPSPCAESAQAPRAISAHGEPFDEWPTVRAGLEGRLQDPDFLSRLDELDGSCFRLCDDHILILLPDACQVDQAQQHNAKIASIAARLLKVVRPVKFAAVQLVEQDGAHGR